jgi:hypothetical protein
MVRSPGAASERRRGKSVIDQILVGLTTLVGAAGLAGSALVVDQGRNTMPRKILTRLTVRLTSLWASAMNKDYGRNRSFGLWQKQTSGKFDALVVKLNAMLLEPRTCPGFISTGFCLAHPYYQKSDDSYRDTYIALPFDGEIACVKRHGASLLEAHFTPRL